MTCSALAWGLALLVLPLIILVWATESKQQRARRWRSTGLTYKAIATRLNCSPSTARRYCIA
ncbi:MAG: hypothetical protein CMA72_09845 [Euryarchaeota archaeon]|nr:hypothetical protein [Euryarchaeota archaeon]